MTLAIIKDKKEEWLLTVNNVQVTSNDYKAFSKLWKEIVDSSLYSNKQTSYRTLFVNDCLQIMYNSMANPTVATVVDPFAYEILEQPLSKHLNLSSFKNIIDTLGNTRSLTLLDDTFEEAYEDCLHKNKYDLIFLNVRQSSDLTVNRVEEYFSILEDFGCLLVQVPSNITLEDEAEKALNHYFSYLSVRVRGSSNNLSQSCLVYRKLKGLM